MTIIESRLAELDRIHLSSGSHDRPEAGLCVMEAAAWLAGEPHSDHPECVDPVIAAFARAWQDRLPDDETRDRVAKPLIPLVVGTRSTPDMQDRRAVMVGDWCWRAVLPAWLDLVPTLVEHAAALRARAEATTVDELRDLTRFGAAAARAAAGDAAGDAARAAAGDAAWAAAGDAARAAAYAALAPTVALIQESGADLIRRMCEVSS